MTAEVETTSNMEVGNISFHLQWNNHLENLQALFKCLFNEQILVDVTIACQDGLLKAHKLILSVCSPFFETIFQENPCKYPTLILRDVTVNEMQSLCQYMYLGSVEVQENDLNSLLKVARELQIKGLSDHMIFNDQSKPEPKFNYTPVKNYCSNEDDYENCSQANGGGPADDGAGGSRTNHQVPWEDDSSGNNTSPEDAGLLSPQMLVDEDAVNENGGGAGWPAANMHMPAATVHMPAATVHMSAATVQMSANTVQMSANTVQMSAATVQMSAATVQMSAATVQMSAATVQTSAATAQRPAAVEAQSRNAAAAAAAAPAGPVECPTCHRAFINKQNLRRHMQTHSGVKPHQCKICSQSFLRLSHLQRHHRTHTGERPFACARCPKSFSRSDKLRDHVMHQHASLELKPPAQTGRPDQLDSAVTKENIANVQNFEEQRVPEPVQELQEPLNLAH